MNSKNWTIFVILFFVLVGCVYYWVVNFTPSIHTPEEELIRKVDSLCLKIDSIHQANDSIKHIIDTTEVRIEHVYEKYIQVHDRIVTQSVNDDCVFFSDYLSEDSKRYIDTINFRSTEAY